MDFEAELKKIQAGIADGNTDKPLPIQYGELAECYKGLQQYDLAVEHYDTAIKLAPDVPEFHFNLGCVYMTMKNYERSVSNFLKVIALNPKLDRPYINLALAYQFLEKHELALANLKKVLSFTAKPDFACYLTGASLMALDRFAEAIVYFKKALESGYQSSDVYGNLTVCLFLEKDMDEANLYYTKTVELHGLNVSLCIARSGYYRTMGNYQEAMADLEQAIALEPDSLVAHINSGQFSAEQHKYEQAKRYYDKALQLKGSKEGLYFLMSRLPAEVFAEDEPSGFTYFLKMLGEDYSKLRVARFSELLQIALDHEAPLLFYHLLGNVYFDTPETILRRPDFEEVARLSKPFRQQFALWESHRKAERESFLAEALMNFYMGNPIRAYQIFNDRIEQHTGDISLMEHYYFLLSASALDEDETSYLQLTILPLVYQVGQDPGSTDTEKYYAALILDLAGKTTEAIDQLAHLAANGYHAANYALAQFKRTFYTNEEAYHAEVLAGFLDWHLAQENYFKKPSLISLDEDEENLVNKLLPLLQLMENKALLENLSALRNKHENIFEERFFFSRYIEFTHLKELIEGNTLEKDNPVIYERIYGSDEERELIEPEIAIFKILEKDQKGILNIVTNLHKGAFTDFIYIRENLTLPPQKTNYRHFMALVLMLHEQGLIDQATLVSLQQYITYCAEAVYSVSGKNEVLGYAISQLKEQVLTFSLFGLSLDTLESIYSLAYNKLHGIQSEVLSYEQFMEQYKKEVQTP